MVGSFAWIVYFFAFGEAVIGFLDLLGGAPGEVKNWSGWGEAREGTTTTNKQI